MIPASLIPIIAPTAALISLLVLLAVSIRAVNALAPSDPSAAE